MRSIILGGSLIALVFAVGCSLAPHQRDSVGGRTAVNAPAPTVENLVAYLNRNAAGIRPDQALVCNNVNIIVDAADAGRGGVDGNMICQAPRNFMMSGKALGSPFVDIGSNNKEFWFWTKQNNPPGLYYCSHDALAQGVKMPFPFQPDMAVNALGLAPYDPTKKYELRTVNGRPKTYELIEQARSPDNRPIKKVTIFNASTQQVPDPQIIGHKILDERGNIVCSATIRTAQPVGNGGLIMPRIVDFSWPEQKMKMTMRIENPRLVDMPPEKAAVTFTRQNLQYQAYDLATGIVDGGAGGLQRTRATTPLDRPGG